MSTGIGDGPAQGVAVAVVTGTEDPAGVGRVQLEYPWETDGGRYWARTAAPMAGEGSGAYFPHEVGDEVLVAFEHGDVRRPYVLGALWSEGSPPPIDAGDAGDVSEIRSSSGHRFAMDDDETEGRVEIESAGGHRIVLDDSGGSESIRIEDSSGTNRIEMDAERGEVTIEAGAKLTLSAPAIEIEADGQLDLASQGPLTLEGALISLN